MGAISRMEARARFEKARKEQIEAWKKDGKTIIMWDGNQPDMLHGKDVVIVDVDYIDSEERIIEDINNCYDNAISEF